MLFNSWAFAVFLPIVFALYWLTPSKYRWAILLLSGYFFYMCWNAVYAVLILFVTLVTYGAARFIGRSGSPAVRKGWLAASLVLCLGVLFVFKYFNFFLDSLVGLIRGAGLQFHVGTLELLLPVGISFYTFQTVGYVIDVYRGDIAAETHVGKYAAFVAFFPQLVAGPIEKAANLLPQIGGHRTFRYEDAAYGLKLMAWGLFKKMVVADTLAAVVDSVYGNLYAQKGFSLALVTVFFALQIYCDFSGYSDIAIGVAKLFDIHLMTNFRSPYLSTSFKTFWSRWHISLSEWFRDYVYIPLGGNRRGKLRRNLNLLITFLVSGIWHGANWTFLLWGGIHGAARIAESNRAARKEKRRQKRLARGKAVKPIKEKKDHPAGLGWLSALGVFAVTALAFVVFRAPDAISALYVFLRMPGGITSPISYIVRGVHDCSLSIDNCVSILLMVSLLFAFDYANLRTDVIKKIGSLRPVLRWSIYVAFILLTLYLLPVHSGGEFIYFQF